MAMEVWGLAKFAPAFQRPAEGQFIRKLKSTSCRQAVSNAGDGEAGSREPLRQIKAGRVALHVSAKSDHDFFDGFGFETPLQFGDSEVIRFHAVQRRNLSPQSVIFAFEGAGFFDADDIHRTFD